MRARLCCLALLPLVAATRIGAGEIPGFTWKGKPNFPGFARGMTAGPDGNLWLTDADANAIGRVVLDGTVTDGYELGTYTAFPIPTPNSFPVAIAAGPDGNLWFVEVNNGGKIGRCTTSGGITEFPLPGPSNGFPGIAGGLDGNVWLSASPPDNAHPARILKVTPAGVTTAFPLAAGVSAFNLVGGPDGNVWFTEKNATVSGIGRITPEGIITDFWLATKSSQMDITLGQDGNLWFTESNANALGRITTDGVITEFVVPTASSYPWAIASGVDGNIWFSEYDAHKIGQLVVATATDQGQATFRDSGSRSFYQAVALVSLPAATQTASVSVAARGTAAAAMTTAGTSACPEPAFIVRLSSSGSGNADQIGAAAPDQCADLVASLSLATDRGYVTRRLASFVFSNSGPNTATSVRFEGALAVVDGTFEPEDVFIGFIPPDLKGSCETNGMSFRCELAALSPEGPAKTVMFSFNGFSDAVVRLEASIGSNTPDPGWTNNASQTNENLETGLATLEHDPGALAVIEVQTRGAAPH